ncbi:MAG: hypothetical protein R3B90_18900 [Planctomycetaceae bacterium]
MLLWSYNSSRIAAGGDANDRYFDGLLQRGLVTIAENEAQRRLGDPLLTRAEEVVWSIRLANAYTRHAELAAGDERQTLWRRADEELTKLIARSAELPQREAIAAARGLVDAQRAELLRWEWEANGRTASLAQAARQSLQQSGDALRELHRQLDAAARAAGRRADAAIADGELTSREVRELQRDVEHALCQSLVSQIELLSPSDDPAKLTREAEPRLNDLTGGWIGDPRVWEARLLRVRLARLAGDAARAATLVKSALSEQPSDWLADRFVAELVRSQMDRGAVDESLQTLLDRGRQPGRMSDELIYLQVEAHLLAAEAVARRGDKEAAAELRQRAIAWSRQVDGGWGARAAQRVGEAESREKYGPEIASASQAARAAYQTGDVAGALQWFARAAELAETQQQFAAAEEFDYTRASILVSQERLPEAVAALDRLLARSAAGAYREDAGLLRAYVLGRLYEAEATRERREAYTAALEAHREAYPGTATGVEATWMLAALEERRNQWTRALELYRAIANDMGRGPQAHVRIAALYELILARLRELQQPPDEWEDRAVEELAACVRSYPPGAAEWSPMQAEVTLRLVRIVLGHREHPYAEADALVQRVQTAGEAQRRSAERDGGTLPVEWQQFLRTAGQLRVVSLAGQGKLDEARDMFNSLAVTDPAVLLELLLGLGELSDGIPAEQRTALGHLQLQAARTLRSRAAELSTAELRALARAEVEAYRATGNLLDAIKGYEALLEQSPRDKELLRVVASLCSELGTPDSLGQGRRLWQRLEAQLEKGSPSWLEARWQVADAAARLGQADDARKLIGLTRLVYPELGGPELKARYDALEARLGK